jgi:hypothetical protein
VFILELDVKANNTGESGFAVSKTLLRQTPRSLAANKNHRNILAFFIIFDIKSVFFQCTLTVFEFFFCLVI